MTELRAAKIAGIADELPPLHVDADPGAGLLVLGWGSSEGAIRAGVAQAREAGHRSRAPTCTISTRCRRTSATCCARSTACWCRR